MKIVLVAAIALLWTGMRTGHAAEQPSYSDVIEKARAAISGFENYRPGVPINREQAAAILDSIEKTGWKIADRSRLLARVPDQKDPLVTLLSGKQGRAFYEKIAVLPGGIDRVDNLLKLPDGKNIVKRLIDGKGGDELIVYLTTAAGGKNLGNMLEKDAKVDFDKPTGKIYTANALMSEVEAAYKKDFPATK